MDDKERLEKYKRISRIAVIVGIISVIAAVMIGIIGFVVSGSNLASRSTEPEQMIEDLEEADGFRNAALMVDTRAKGSEAEKGSLAELLADRQVYFAGIEDAVISEDTVIYLENLKENGDILIQYEVIDKENGESLETTGLIPSGEHVAWVPGEALEKGTHTLILHESPFYPYEGEYFALTQGNNEVTFTIQ